MGKLLGLFIAIFVVLFLGGVFVSSLSGSPYRLKVRNLSKTPVICRLIGRQGLAIVLAPGEEYAQDLGRYSPLGNRYRFQDADTGRVLAEIEVKKEDEKPEMIYTLLYPPQGNAKGKALGSRDES